METRVDVDCWEDDGTNKCDELSKACESGVKVANQVIKTVDACMGAFAALKAVHDCDIGSFWEKFKSTVPGDDTAGDVDKKLTTIINKLKNVTREVNEVKELIRANRMADFRGELKNYNANIALAIKNLENPADELSKLEEHAMK